MRSLFLLVPLAAACSSSDAEPATGRAAGAACTGPSECQTFSCTCPSGKTLDNAQVCENNVCAAQDRACSSSCEAAGSNRSPTGAGRVAVCDESLTAFASCPPSTADTADCKKRVADTNCGRTMETYVTCANTHVVCLGGPTAPECATEKTDAESCFLAF